MLKKFKSPFGDETGGIWLIDHGITVGAMPKRLSDLSESFKP